MKKGGRYNAFSINLGDDGGETKLLCPVDKCLEVYSTKGVYQIFPPESLDPKETNPDMPAMSKKVSDIGTSNWIVARIMVQNYQYVPIRGFNLNLLFMMIKLFGWIKETVIMIYICMI